jgi:maltose O-acetyltransferase
MTMYDKMMAGELFHAHDADLVKRHHRALELVERFNRTGFDEEEKRQQLLRQLLGGVGKGASIKPPFFCDIGTNIYLGDNVYLNYDCVLLDGNRITIGADVLIGPRVQLYTASHPLDPNVRKQQLEFTREIVIGESVWIGGGAIVCPGVTIGKNTVIGAGSVVVKDIPEGVLAVGNPCRVVKPL